MRRLLLLLPNLEYGSIAAQAMQLILALPDEFERRVFVLGKVGPWVEKLRVAGVHVEASGEGRLFDLRPMVRLRGLMREYAPHVVHVFGTKALRPLALTGFKGRLVVSPCPRPHTARSLLQRLDHWFLRKAHHVVAFGQTEAERCRQMGVDPARIVTVQPAVSVCPLSPSPPVLRGRGVRGEGAERCSKPGLFPLTPSPSPPEYRGRGELMEQSAIAEPTARTPYASLRYLLCIGPLEMHKGFQDAVWAFDIVRYIHPDLHLVLVGEGPERERLPVYIDGLKTTEFVHFTGAVPEVFSLLRGAQMLWCPGRMETGTQVVLEAMAVGTPVVAARFPRLSELIVEGETGFLVPPLDKPLLARQTHLLLTDESLRRRMGEVARGRAEEQFRPETLAEQCASLYKG